MCSAMLNLPTMSGSATLIAVFRDLVTFMMEDSRNISLCTHLLR
jgi:hypothetical protein